MISQKPSNCFYSINFFSKLPRNHQDQHSSLHDALPISCDKPNDVIERWISAFGTPTSARSIGIDRKSTRLNSSHVSISYAVFCLKKKKTIISLLYFERR